MERCRLSGLWGIRSEEAARRGGRAFGLTVAGRAGWASAWQPAVGGRPAGGAASGFVSLPALTGGVS